MLDCDTAISSQPRFQQTSVSVGEEVGQVELDCPDLTEPGEEISCLLWLVTGSQLKLTLEMDKGFVDPQEYTIPGQLKQVITEKIKHGCYLLFSYSLKKNCCFLYDKIN